MNIAVYLSYSGLGANLLHLAYCHEIAKKYGPITILTLNQNLSLALKDDSLIKEVIVIEKNYKKFRDVLKLSNFLEKFKFDKLFIFYPSLRILFAAKLAHIKEVSAYPFYVKKNLHLVEQAKKFTEKILNSKNCPTETKIEISTEKLTKVKEFFKKEKFNIIIGAGSSGPTTKWGTKNYINLINKLNNSDDFFFFILCGPNEKEISDEIIRNVRLKNCISLSEKNIEQVMPFLASCDMYVGNDSFGHHVVSQNGKPSLVLMIDTPKAYSDYSINQIRILPENIKLTEMKHNSGINPNDIKLEKVFNKILELKIK